MIGVRQRANSRPKMPEPGLNTGRPPPRALPSEGGSRITGRELDVPAVGDTDPLLSDYCEPMRIHVDADKCQGHNRCYALAPELFDVDDYGNAVVVGDGTVPPALEEKARLAVANCPEFAITISQ